MLPVKQKRLNTGRTNLPPATSGASFCACLVLFFRPTRHLSSVALVTSPGYSPHLEFLCVRAVTSL